MATLGGMFTGGPFTQGYLTGPQAAELNQLWAKVRALDAIGVISPLTVTRGPVGQPIIGGIGSLTGGDFWAELTASAASPARFSWKRKVLGTAGTFLDVFPPATGTLNAYPTDGSPVVGDVVRMWPSPTKPDAFEFDAPGGTAPRGSFVRGKLDGSLSFGGSATMSVWAWNGSATVDTGEDVTVYDWYLSSGQSVAAGIQGGASWDAASGRYIFGPCQCPP